jgi:hypothetical protein
VRHPKARKTPNPLKTECKYGHPMEGDNLRWRKRGDKTVRACAECIRRRNRESSARRYERSKHAKSQPKPPIETVDPRILLCRKEWAKRSTRLLAQYGLRVA